jgi:ferredoxin-like protein FixX
VKKDTLLRFHYAVSKQTLLYCSICRILSKRIEQYIEAAELRFPRSSFGVTRTDHVGYEVLIAVTKKSNNTM